MMQAVLFGDEHGDVTIAEERARLDGIMWSPKGSRCRCCNRMVKGYKRSFNSGMARLLIWVAQQCEMKPGGRYWSIPDFAPRDVIRGREPDKVEHWGFIERAENQDAKKRESGRWRVTDLGVRFVMREVKAPKRIWVYDNRIFRTDGETDIVKALGKHFDYSELMGRPSLA